MSHIAHSTAQNREEAWSIVDMVFPTDYTKDEESSARAGYPIYRSPISHYDYICDLNTRLEVNLKTGETVNVWIEDYVETARRELAKRTRELYPN